MPQQGRAPGEARSKGEGGERSGSGGGGGRKRANKGGGGKSARPPGDAPAKMHFVSPAERGSWKPPPKEKKRKVKEVKGVEGVFETEEENETEGHKGGEGEGEGHERGEGEGHKGGEGEGQKKGRGKTEEAKEKETRKYIGDELLQVIYHHRYLDLRQSTRAIHPTYRNMSRRKTREIRDEMKKRLAILESHRLLERMIMPDRTLWIATKMGQEEMRKTGIVNKGYPTPRGVEAIGYKHTFFVNETGLSFLEHLEDMTWKSWRHEEGFMVGSGREMVIPDAVLEYEDPAGVVHARFLEIDRNTEKVHTLTDKIWDYHRYYHLSAKKQKGDIIPDKVWEQRFPFGFPDVIFVWSGMEPDQGWLRSVKLADQMRADRRYDKLGFHVLAGSAVHLDRHGPLSETALDLCHKGREVTWVSPPTERELGTQVEGELEPLTEEEAEEAALLPPTR